MRANASSKKKQEKANPRYHLSMRNEKYSTRNNIDFPNNMQPEPMVTKSRVE